MTQARLFAAAAALALGGCSTFTTTKKLDMTPFAETTTAMIGEAAAQSRPAPWLYLRKHQSRPSVVATREAVQPLRRLMRGVALYSMQVVGLNESRLTEKKKLEELARYVVEVVRPNVEAGLVEEIGVSAKELDNITAEIKGKETFLEGVAAAQPLVNATMLAGNKILDILTERIEVAAADVNAVIETQFAPLKENIADIERVQMREARSFTLVARVRHGEEGALEALLQSDPDLKGMFKSGKAPTTAEVDAAERRVFDQLQRIEAIRDQLIPEITLYKETQRELDSLRISAEEQARWGRATLAVWARTHRNLGAGIAVPPAIDVVGMLTKGATSAAKTVVPF